ncbi:MAG: hypothetical protein KGJ13_10300 [Patescibacteria group bacterium]|nr:hypothetical protein [Patescibacteria group bacterium]
MKPERKPPVIRRGQKKPFVKATLKEQEERIEWLAKEFAKNPAMGKHEAHRIMLKRYNITWSTVDSIYIPRAKKLLHLRTDLTTGEVQDLVSNTLIEEVPKMKGAAKVAALRLLCDIFGVVVSRHVVAQTKNPVNSIQDMTEAEIENLPSERLREIIAGN